MFQILLVVKLIIFIIRLFIMFKKVLIHVFSRIYILVELIVYTASSCETISSFFAWFGKGFK